MRARWWRRWRARRGDSAEEEAAEAKAEAGAAEAEAEAVMTEVEDDDADHDDHHDDDDHDDCGDGGGGDIRAIGVRAKPLFGAPDTSANLPKSGLVSRPRDCLKN
jgi:hypothetical protein